MNEFLRIFKRAFNRFGYDLKKTGKATLLPLQIQDKNLQTAWQTFHQDRVNPEISHSNLDKLVVFIRTCLRSNRNVCPKPRFTGASASETIYRCLRSTVRSIQHAHHQAGNRRLEVIILDDHSDALEHQEIEKICANIPCPWQIKTTDETGQGNSLLEQFTFARGLNALCYFCEDDYLHEPSAIWEMWDFYRQIVEETSEHLVLHPQECEFMYQTHYPSYIVTSQTRHWRTMNHATHVLLTHSHVVAKFWQYFENTRYVGHPKRRQEGSESKTTNLLFSHIPGFCPIPALAGHAQFDFTLPPCFNWQKIWESNATS